MKITLFCFLMLVATTGWSQGAGESHQPAQSFESALTFDQGGFNGRFAVMALSEADYDYYVTDLTRLETRFQRVYFLNLTYDDHRLVNIDPDITGAQLWFKAHYQYKEDEITCLLDDLKKETKKTVENWTESEQKLWLDKFDKFNTLEDDGK